MATNWSKPSRDFPSKADVQRMERRDRERQREQHQLEDRIESYRRNHPSASWAEAEYKTRNTHE